MVKPSVGKAGAKLYAEGKRQSRVIGSVMAKEMLTVLEDKKQAKDKIGSGGKMISVRAVSGLQGFVEGSDVKIP